MFEMNSFIRVRKIESQKLDFQVCDLYSTTMERKYQDVGKIDNWIERLLRCEYLTEAEVQELCVKVGLQ